MSSKSFWLTALEPFRASIEFAALGASFAPLMLAPRGDGHPVLVLPGWRAGDTSTAPLRHYLDYLGYQTLPWQLGTNRGVQVMWPKLIDRFHEVIDGMPAEESLSLVGWSLGGSLALGLSYVLPKRVRRVITLGSPQLPGQSLAAPAVRASYRLQYPSRISAADLWADWPWPQRVPPHTAIFSRSDGVVATELAMGGATVHDRIEVISSHVGLGVNPAVFYALADRLQADPQSKFQPSSVLATLYPSHRPGSSSSN